MRVAIGLAALAAAGACAAAEPAAKPAAITNPDWLARPSGEDIARYYPLLAQRLEMEGLATLSCTVNAAGDLVDCKSVYEAPADFGFGAAVLKIASTFKMKPMTVNGKPVDGGTVRIPIRFVLPKGEGPNGPAEPPHASPTAMTQALRLVDTGQFVSATAQRFESVTDGGDAPPTLRQETRTALHDAVEAHKVDLRDAFARAFASVYAEGEMAAIADFNMGPGKAVQTNTTLQAVRAQVFNTYRRTQRDAAHDAFCAARACGSPAELAAVWRAADPRDNRLDNPQWSEAPSSFALRRAAPALYDAIGLTGAVRLTCKVVKEGKLEGCGVDEELPKGMGYGAAAVSLTGQYRLSPIQLTGAEGRKVTVRVGFTPTTLPDAQPPPAPKSARALELGRRIVDSDPDDEATGRRTIELQILQYQAPMPKGVDGKTYDAAIEAYRTGSNAARTAGRAQTAAGWAAALSEDELSALAAYRATPAAKAQSERREALGVAMTKAAMYAAQAITADVHKALCATRTCPVIVRAPASPAMKAPG